MAKRGPLFHLAGMTATVLGAGLGAAQIVALRDRSRSTGASGAFVEPPGTLHHEIEARDGGLLHVMERGDRALRPLVLLHGVTLSSKLWYYQLEDLADRFRVICPDWRGHGRSAAGAEGYGLDRLARDLTTVLEDLEVRDAVVLGHSMGGMALMKWIGDHPDHLRRHAAGIVFLSTTCSDVATGSVSQLFRLANTVLFQRKPGLADHVPVSVPGSVGYAVVRSGFGQQPAAEWVDATREMLASMSPRAAGRSVLAMMEHDARDLLSGIDIPSLVIVGDHDRITPASQSRLMAQLLGGSELLVLEGAGHMIMLERRAELAKALVDFAGHL